MIPGRPGRPAPRLRLERVGLARARSLAAGDLSVVNAAPGWPHADSLDGLRISAEHAGTDDETPFLAVLVETGQVVGEGGWKGGPDGSGDAEIGYGLAAPFRGRGLGTELVALLAGWAAAQPGVRRVTAHAMADNLPSRRALEANGFAVIGGRPPYVDYARDV